MSTEGLEMMSAYTTSWAQENTPEILESIISKSTSPELVNQDSLLYVLDNTVAVELPPSHAFQAEIYQAYQDEAELLLLGQQSLEDTLDNAAQKIQAIVDANRD